MVFTWSTGSCVTAYTLFVGTSKGAGDIFQSTPGVTFQATVTNLPTNGSTVFVRLSSLIGGVTQNADYTYTASTATSGCGSTGTPATMLTPTPGSTITDSSVTFTWTAGCNNTQYYLYVGTFAGGNDIYAQSQLTNLSGTVTGLPSGVHTLFVRLWSFFSGAVSDVNNGWHFNDYTYVH